MGEVYTATDTKLGRLVAIKLLSSSAAVDSDTRQRFLQEARSAAALNHPNIVTIHAVDQVDGQDFIVMELVEGETLRSRAKQGGMEFEQVVELGVQIADALAAAHAIGLIHRDIKPANIVVTKQGVAKVLDFGLAKQMSAAAGAAADSDATVANMTAPGLIIGTVAYMSPEQTRGEELDARSDIFSLGASLYEALTGKTPFAGESALETMHHVATLTPMPPSVIRPELPADLDLIVSRAMAKNRDDRYQSARDLADALRGLRVGGEYASGLTTAARPLAERGPNNLPSQVTSFIGRRRERTDVRRLFSSTRLVTLTGAGGTGKTRLAIQVASDMLVEFPDGAWLVELETLDDAHFVPQSVASVLGVQEEPGKPFAATLADSVGERGMLLVLDNCEHVAAAVASLGEVLLRSCPNLRILATSRESLGLGGETVWRVPTLSVPDIRTSAIKTKDGAGRYESVRLFVDRATATQPSFQFTDRNAPTIAQICHRLDGIPLAIELAAVRVKVLPVEKILTRLEDRFALLTGGSRTALPRQQTLRAAVDWSYELLSPQEKALLNRVSVFLGGFTLEAAEEVCATDGISSSEVLDLVSALVDKSLAVPEESDEETVRYRLLETIREYGSEKLRDAGEDSAMAERHGEFFLALAETAEPELRGPDQASWFNRLEREHDNLRLAIRGHVSRGSAERAQRLAGALWRFWWVRGFWDEGRRRSSDVLTMPGAVEAVASRAKALHGSAVLARGQGDYAAAKSLLDEALAIGRELGDKAAIGDALFELGNIANAQEDLTAARALYEESLTMRRELNDRPGTSFALHNLGVVAHAMGDSAGARVVYEEALALHRELGNVYAEAASLNGLGDVSLYQGDLAAAREFQVQSLEIQRRLGDKRGIAFSLRMLGRIAEKQGDFTASRKQLVESLELLKEMGDKEGLADSLEGMVSLAAATGDCERALKLAGATAALREAINVPLSQPDQEQLERAMQPAYCGLEPEDAARFRAAGRSMTLDQAVAEAMRG